MHGLMLYDGLAITLTCHFIKLERKTRDSEDLVMLNVNNGHSVYIIGQYFRFCETLYALETHLEIEKKDMVCSIYTLSETIN